MGKLCGEQQKADEVAEKKPKLPDWMMRIMTTIVLGIGSALVSVWNDNIVAKQDIISLKEYKARSVEEMHHLRSELGKQYDHNRLILDKLEDIAESHHSSRKRR